MAFNCHQDDLHSVFTCKSSFTKYVPPIEKLSIQDNVPEIEKIERKKNNNVKFLPGERLLINLEKDKQKHKKKQDPKTNLNVKKVQESLNRILTVF